MDSKPYLERLISQHRGKPKLDAWLGAALDIVEPIFDLYSHFDLDAAVGVQLEVLGELVGIARELRFQPSDGSSPILEDEPYRTLIRAKVAQNYWDGTNETLPEVWSAVFPDSKTLSVRDNQDMTMTAVITNIVRSIEVQLIAHGYIVPKPSTVRLNVELRIRSETTLHLAHQGFLRTRYTLHQQGAMPPDARGDLYIGGIVKRYEHAALTQE